MNYIYVLSTVYAPSFPHILHTTPFICVLLVLANSFFTLLGSPCLHFFQCCWSGMQEPAINPMRARIFRPSGHHGPTQADMITSNSLTDLLNGPLGDTCFSDRNTPGYRSGVTSRSMLGSDFYFNKRNSGSGFHSQSEYPSQSPPGSLVTV